MPRTTGYDAVVNEGPDQWVKMRVTMGDNAKADESQRQVQGVPMLLVRTTGGNANANEGPEACGKTAGAMVDSAKAVEGQRVIVGQRHCQRRTTMGGNAKDNQGHCYGQRETTAIRENDRDNGEQRQGQRGPARGPAGAKAKDDGGQRHG